MMRVIPSDTITIVIGEAPRRWNGVYTPEFTSMDSSAQAMTAAGRPSHTEYPALLTT